MLFATSESCEMAAGHRREVQASLQKDQCDLNMLMVLYDTLPADKCAAAGVHAEAVPWGQGPEWAGVPDVPAQTEEERRNRHWSHRNPAAEQPGEVCHRAQEAECHA